MKQRGRRTNECLDVVRQLWTGEPVTYEGRHFNLKGASINPPPTQRPGPPVWVSGRRDAAMLRAATYGDGWMPYFYNPQRYRDSVAKITTYAESLGKDLTDFQWACFPYISIYPTEQEAAEVAARQLGWTDAALLCGHEMDVPCGLKKVIRILLLVNTEKSSKEMKHVYIKEAVKLRPDSTGPAYAGVDQ